MSPLTLILSPIVVPLLQHLCDKPSSFALERTLMLATIGSSSTTRRISKAATARSISLLLLAASAGLVQGTTAIRFTHHKAAAAAKGAVTNGTTSRNASFASDRRGSGGSGGSAGWGSSVDNPFKMERPLNVFGRPLAQCGTDPITGFYRDGVRNQHGEIIHCLWWRC